MADERGARRYRIIPFEDAACRFAAAVGLLGAGSRVARRQVKSLITCRWKPTKLRLTFAAERTLGSQYGLRAASHSQSGYSA